MMMLHRWEETSVSPLTDSPVSWTRPRGLLSLPFFAEESFIPLVRTHEEMTQFKPLNRNDLWPVCKYSVIIYLIFWMWTGEASYGCFFVEVFFQIQFALPADALGLNSNLKYGWLYSPTSQFLLVFCGRDGEAFYGDLLWPNLLKSNLFFRLYMGWLIWNLHITAMTVHGQRNKWL